MSQAAYFYIFFWMTSLTSPNEDWNQSENLDRSGFAHLHSPWQLERFSEFGWTIMNCLSGPQIKTLKYPGCDSSAIDVVLENGLTKSPGLMAFIILCSIITSILILAICMMCAVYQRRDNNMDPADPIPNPNRVDRWWWLILLLVSITMCLFGGSAYLLGEFHASEQLPAGFELADKIIDSTHFLKTSFLEQLTQMTHRIPVVSNELFSALDLKQDVVTEFLKISEPYTRPIITETFRVDMNLDRLLSSLMNMKTDITHLMNNSISNLNKEVLIFNGILDTIKNDAKRFLSAVPVNTKLMSVEKLPEIEVDLGEVERQFKEPIKNFQNIISRDVIQHTAGLESNLSKAVEYLSIDFTFMLKDMKNSIFQTEVKLREIKNVILSGADNIYSQKVKNDQKAMVNQLKYSAESQYFEISTGLTNIGALSILTTLPFLIGLIFCFFGTNCLMRMPEASQLQWLQIGIQILWGASFFAATVLFIFWILSMVIFTYSVLPVLFCQSMENLTILDEVLDNDEFWKDMGYDGFPWDETFPSHTWKPSFRAMLLRCKKGKGLYNALSLDDAFGKVAVNFTGVNTNFDHLMGKISENVAEISKSELKIFDEVHSEMSGLLDGINIDVFFENVTKLTQTAVKQRSYSILKSTSEHPHISNALKTKLYVAGEYLANIKANSSTIIMNKRHFLNDLDSLKSLLQQIKTSLHTIHLGGKKYNNYISNKAAEAMMDAINNVANHSLEGIGFGIDRELFQMQNHMTNCVSLWQLYEKAGAISCYGFLHGVMAMWLGLFIFAIFLIPTIILTVLLIFALDKQFSPRNAAAN